MSSSEKLAARTRARSQGGIARPAGRRRGRSRRRSGPRQGDVGDYHARDGPVSVVETFGAQTKLTILPLSLFGTDAQKRKYLPRLLRGDDWTRAAAGAGANGSLYCDEHRSVENSKQTGLVVLASAMETYQDTLGDQQEVLMHLADIVIDIYSAESALLRAASAANTDTARATLHADAVRVFVDEASPRVERSARQALAILLKGDSLRGTVNGLRRQFESMPIDLAAPRRRLSDEAVGRGAYVFQP